MFDARLVEQFANRINQPLIARQPKDIIDTVRLAPGHDLLAGKARVAADDDLGAWKTSANRADDWLQFLHDSRTRVDIRRAKTCAKDMVAGRNVERKITVAVVVAVKKPPLLLAMQRIIGRIHVQHQPRWCLVKRMDKFLHQ